MLTPLRVTIVLEALIFLLRLDGLDDQAPYAREHRP